MHRRITAVVTTLAALTAAALVTGCSSGDSSIGPSSSAAASSTSAPEKEVAPDTSAPSSGAPSSSVPTSSTPTPAVNTRTSTPPPGLRDFGAATYSVPSGFQENGDYRPLTPLEDSYTAHFLAPTDSTNTKEVIGIYVYALPAARSVTAKTDQLALIKAYNAKAKAVVSGSIRPAVSSIDGLPAYTETATEPGDYTYIAYWAFGTHHFLQFSCQLGSTNAVASLAVACGTTLASLQLN